MTDCSPTAGTIWVTQNRCPWCGRQLACDGICTSADATEWVTLPLERAAATELPGKPKPPRPAFGRPSKDDPLMSRTKKNRKHGFR